MLQDQREDAGTQQESQLETLWLQKYSFAVYNDNNLVESYLEFVDVFTNFVYICDSKLSQPSRYARPSKSYI